MFNKHSLLVILSLLLIMPFFASEQRKSARIKEKSSLQVQSNDENEKPTSNVLVEASTSTSSNASAPDIHQKFALGAYFSPGIEPVVRNFISRTKTGIDTAQYRFTLFSVAQALAQLKKDNPTCVIRILSDNKFKGDSCAALRHTAEAGCLVRAFTKKPNVTFWKKELQFQTMHHKFALFEGVDGKDSILMTGSYNWTGQAETGNCENIIITADPECIQKFKDQFNFLWDTCSKPVQTDELTYSGKTPKSFFSRAMNRIFNKNTVD